MSLSGRVCIITGGASGIGAAGCRRFAAGGATVVVADVNRDGADAVAREIGAEAVAVDVGDEASVAALVEHVVRTHGRLDVLWANAGIAGFRAPCAEQPTDTWERVLRVNLTGVFFSLRAALQPMLAAGRGVLLATASVAGMRRAPAAPPTTSPRRA